jgi:hypothetical protein
MTAPKQDDDDDVLIGNRTMAEFSTSEGFSISVSSMQKHTSPAINTGPELIGYVGAKPTSTKGRVRARNRSRIRPVRQPARPDQPAPVAGAVAVITAPVPIVAEQPSTRRRDHAIQPNA